MNAVASLFHPLLAKGEREFLVTVRPEGGRTEQITIWATCAIDALLKVQDERGNTGRVTVEAL